MQAVQAVSGDLREVGAQLPRASEAQPGARVVVYASPRRGWLGKMLAREGAPLHVLCSALLVRGYTEIGGGEEDGRVCAWGVAPAPAREAPEAPENVGLANAVTTGPSGGPR
jgi:hypothetical protein